MRLIIAGGGGYQFMADDMRRLDQLHQQRGITEVVSGGATGADSCGEVWAKLRGIPVRVFHADWKAYGKEAEHKRNRQMAEYADAAILFAGGREATNMHTEAVRAGLTIYDYRDAMSGSVGTLEPAGNAWRAAQERDKKHSVGRSLPKEAPSTLGSVLGRSLKWWITMWLGCAATTLPFGDLGATGAMLYGTLWVTLGVVVCVPAVHGVRRLIGWAGQVPPAVRRKRAHAAMVAMLATFFLLRLLRVLVIAGIQSNGYEYISPYHLWPPAYALGGAAVTSIAYGAVALVVVGAVRLIVRSKEHLA